MLAALKAIGAALGISASTLTLQTDLGTIEIPNTIEYLEYDFSESRLKWKVPGENENPSSELS